MLSYARLLNVMIIFTFFKSIFLIVFPGVFINMIIFSILFMIIFSLIWNRNINLTYFNMLLLITFSFLTILIPVSIFVNDIHPKLVLYAYLRILFVLFIFFIATNIKLLTLRKTIAKISKIIYIYMIIGFVEWFIPISFKKNLIEWFVLQKVGGTQTSLNMYYFKDFGPELFRLGSIVFEPITFSMVSAIGIYLLIKKHKNISKIFFYILINFATLAKSGTITLLFIYLSQYFKKYFLPFIYFFSFLIIILFTLYFGNLVIELIDSDKSYSYIKVFITHFATVGNHIVGLVMGIVGGFKAPFIGHGLGTAGYIISNEAIKLGMEGPTILNGNESTVGTLVYQIGFGGLYLIFLIFNHYLRRAKLNKDYTSIGLILGFYIFMMLSESAFAMAIITLFIFSIVYVDRINIQKD